MTDFKTLYLADYQLPNYLIKAVDLTFELLANKTLVTSVLTIERQSNENRPLILNGEQLTLISIALNHDKMPTEHYHVNEHFLEVMTEEKSFILTIVTEVNPEDNTSLEGLYKSGDSFCTQCEAEGFRRITYYLDRPDVMAIFTCKIIANKKQFPSLLSNGNKIDSGDLANGLHFVKWYDPFPKPCYLFALVAGSFDILSDTFTTISGREVALEIYVDKGNLNKANHAMASLIKSMDWDEKTFNLEYDLDIYMIVAVDFFNMGAMENKGLNIFNSKCVLADEYTATDTDYFNIEAVIGHEYFHNWTGNRVTCRDWFQLSLKEGLTVFRDQQFSADMNSAIVTRIKNVRHLRSIQFAEDAGPMSHPIRPEQVIEMNNFYTMTVYEKGAEVIRMMHTLLGEKSFKAGMALYFERFDGQAVTCENFVNAMADASQIDLTQFKLWYSQAGTPVLTVKQSFDRQTQKCFVTISQKNQGKAALHIPIKIELIDLANSSSKSHLLELTGKQNTWVFEEYKVMPTLAFLAGFSAPVKVDFFQGDDELAIIMSDAADGFCRWDAGHKLMTNYIKQLTENINSHLPNKIIETFRSILTQDESKSDHAFIAEQLTLPNFEEMVDVIDQVNPLDLLMAIDKLKQFLALELKEELWAKYQQCQQFINKNEHPVANRALKNTCLSYLCLLPDHLELIDQQFNNATNMTDTLAALHCSAANNFSGFKEQMSIFADKWQDTTLVMDKWFILNASLSSEHIFTHLEALLLHPLFSLKNPNRARSLIGAFTGHNHKYFHCITGRGYQFLAKQVALLNTINPQVASRLINPLIQFKGLDKRHQALMKAELVKLRSLENLSIDLTEKLDAAIT